VDAYWNLSWPFGSLSITPNGGKLVNLEFRDGRAAVATPLYEAPWLTETHKPDDPLLADLRGEFSCLPFGGTYPKEELVGDWRCAVQGSTEAAQAASLDPTDKLLHGFCASANWELVQQTDTAVEIRVEYPAASAIESISRLVWIEPEQAKIYVSMTVCARRRCKRPIGFHPNFALDGPAGSFTLNPGSYFVGVTHPGSPAPGVSRVAQGKLFTSLSKVPLKDGGEIDLTQLPLKARTEEIVQLLGCSGNVSLRDKNRRVTYELAWDARLLPSVLLWFSNGGRNQFPWNSRNLCLGIEPVAAAFDLGCVASLSNNPINGMGVATASWFTPGEPQIFTYELTAKFPNVGELVDH